MLITCGRNVICAQGSQRSEHQQDCGGEFHSFHTALRVKPRRAASESMVAHTVTKVTTRVRFTSTGKSRDCAACQASWPIPGTSQMTSTGSSTPIAMLTRSEERRVGKEGR